jgi:uncharacterized membrane protein
MNILLSPDPVLFWTSTSILLVLILIAIRYAPWKLLLAEQSRQHFLFATVLALALLWLLQIRVMNLVAFHPLLITVITMIFGWSFTLLIGALALIVLEIYQLAVRSALVNWDLALTQFNFETLPVDFCLSVAVPATWALCVIGLVNRWKFKNPFTYFWGVGFFGAMLSCFATGLTAILLFTLTSSERELFAVKENFIVFAVMTFPEGFINGSIATMLTIFWPDIMKTYRDDWFLKD